MLTYDYVVRVTAFDPANGRWDLHAEIVTRTAEDPYRYRVLVPGGIYVLQRLGLASPDGAGLDRLYAIYFLASLLAILLATRWLLGSLGFDRGHALAGALLAGALLPLTLRDHGFQPWSWLEAVTVLLAAGLTTLTPRPWLFAALMVVATLNRETAVVLPALAVAAAVVHRRDTRLRNRWLSTATLGLAAWGATRALVYLVVGRADSRVITVEEIYAMNTSPGAAQRTAAVLFLLLLGGVTLSAVLAAVTRRLSPWPFWTALLGVPPYLGGWLVFAAWWEVRVLLPALLILIPAALSALIPPGGGSAARAVPEGVDG